MTSTLNVITATLRKLGVVATGENADADAAGEALFALNAMMHGWKLRGVDISHSDLTLGDNFPLADEYVEGTVYLLAARLSPDFMLPASFDADDWFRTFQAAYASIPTLTPPYALTRPPSREDRDGNLPLTT